MWVGFLKIKRSAVQIFELIEVKCYKTVSPPQYYWNLKNSFSQTNLPTKEYVRTSFVDKKK